MKADKSIARKERSLLTNQMRHLKEIIMPFQRTLCYKKSLFIMMAYFYAFDYEEEKKACKIIFEKTIGLLSIKELNIKQDNIVIFGLTLTNDLKEEEPEEAGKIYSKKGLIGLIKKFGFSYPDPLFYDRIAGNVYFFSDGSASFLSKDGKKKQTLDKLNIDIV